MPALRILVEMVKNRRSVVSRLPWVLGIAVLASQILLPMPRLLAQPPAGLVAAYGMNEGTGTTLGDWSTSRLNGTISGATWTADGRFGGALAFDGANDWVTVADAAPIDLTTGMTLEAWVNPTALGTWRNVLIKERPSGEVYNLYAHDDTSAPSVFVVRSAQNGSPQDARGTGAIPLNTWTHLAATFDNTTLRLYVNGTQVRSRAVAGPLLTSSGALRIGGNSLWGEYFQGRIDEVRIYNRALTAAELQSDMNLPIGDSAGDTAAPVRSNAGPSGALPSSTTQATLTLVTNEAAICRYATGPGVPYTGMATTFAVTGATSHSTTVTGLSAGNGYSYFVRCQDTAGNANADDLTISFSVAGQGQDGQAPAVSLTAPADQAVVAGVVTLTASASDNVGVAGVQFLVDGAALGAEDTTAAYSRTWDTTQAADGFHTLTAVARDAAGNRTTSAPIVVRVANAPASPGALYVSPSGNDANAGTEAAPFQTIERARAAVRAMAATMSADIVVYLRGGLYQLANPIVFDAQDSGRNGFTVTYRAYPGERPVLSGGQYITGWVSAGNGLYRAPAGSLRFRQLYVNARRAIRARTPDAGQYFELRSWDTGGRRIEVAADEVGNWQRRNQVEMIVLGRGVNQSNLRIASVSTSGGSAFVTPSDPERTRIFQQAYPPKDPFRPYFFENALEFLDSPGEWYLNTDTNEVFYRPRAGEDPATLSVVAPRLEQLVRVAGTLAEPVHHLQFHGLTFEHSTWLVPNAEGYVGDQASIVYTQPLPDDEITSYPGHRLPGGVHVEAASMVRFERNVFRHMGASGLNFAVGVSDSAAVGNLVQDVSGTGIAVDVNLEGNPTDTRKISRRNDISNNYIAEIGRDYYQAVGIMLGYTDAAVVEHNELSDMPYSGISVGWGWDNRDSALRNNIVRYNRVQDVLNRMSDGGGIYTLSRQPGTLIAENYVHDIVRSGVQGGFNMSGIYLDEGSNFITVRDNVLINTADRQIFENAVGSGNSYSNNSGTSASVIANAGLQAAYADIRPGSGEPDPEPRVDCAVSAWGAWTPITAWSACTAGSQSRTEQRTRSIVTPPSGGGAACPALTETRTATQTCSAPQAAISAPMNGATFRAGDAIPFAGSGTDPDDGALPASAYTWSVILHHDSHTHQAFGPVSGITSGSFTVPTSGHDFSGNTYYEIILTVTDSSGLQQSTSVTAQPRKVNLAFATSPTGLTVNVDGVARTAPFTLDTLTGFQHTIAAPDQALGGSSYGFVSWSDGGTQTHGVTVGETGATYTATFVVSTVTAVPSSATVLTGTLSGGTVAALVSDDNSYYAVNSTTSGQRTAAWYGAFTGVPNGLSNLRVNYKGNNSGSCTQTVAIWNWSTSAWIDLDSRSVGTTEVAIDNLAPAGTLADYVSGTSGNGELRVRIQCTTTQNRTSRGDRLSIVYDRPVEADTTPPARTSGAPAGTLPVGTTQATLALTTDESATCRYATTAGVPYISMPGTFSTSGSTTHATAVTGLDDGGSYTFFVRCQDQASNANTDDYAISFSVADDAAPPVRSNGQPSGTLAMGTTQTVISLATDEIATCRYGTTAGIAYASLPGVFAATGATSHSTTVTNLFNGSNYIYYVRCQDAAGNVNTSDFAIAFTVANTPPPDTTAPGVSVTAPANGASVSGTVTINATATDNVGIAGVQFLVNGTPLGSEDTTAPYSASWTTTSVANGGPYTLAARARDAAGNTTTASIDVTVDNIVVGLVAAYSFDEGSGTTLIDRTGLGRTGTVSGATWTTQGRNGGALSFDGVNDWVTIADANDLDFTTGMTLEAWVYPTTLGSWRTVLMKERPGGEAYNLYAHTDTNRPKTYVVRAAATNTPLDAAGASALPVNTWSHLAATFDNGTLRLYVNGVQVGTRSVTGPMVTSTGVLRMGGNNIWGEYFAGRIDDVRLYNRALTAAQIQSDMGTAVQP